jgi:hypothetical protein
VDFRLSDRQQVIVHDDEYVPDERQGEAGFEENAAAGRPEDTGRATRGTVGAARCSQNEPISASNGPASVLMEDLSSAWRFLAPLLGPNDVHPVIRACLTVVV